MKNVLKPFLLLTCITFCLSSCEALKPLDRNDISYNRAAHKKRGSAAAKSPKTEISQLRFDIADYAKNYIGTRYRYASTNPNAGFDCSGFTSYVMGNFDIKMPHGSDNQAILGNRIDVQQARPGDLLFFGNRGRISHVAMVVANTPEDGLQIAHSTNSQGVIVENVYSSDYWMNKLMFARDVIDGRK
ncbi:MAG: C40 family peptidase [Saprospiraceae bacterium]|nr:C40 family peptidase [Saprospiraceae bacterium]MBP7679529.1 C40 family peptidase [Saprospiraceae bacterium]